MDGPLARAEDARAWQWFLFAGAALAALVAILPAGQAGDALRTAGNAAAALAVGFRARRSHAAIAPAWRLIFAGLAFAFGLNLTLAIGAAWPSLAIPHGVIDALFLAPYALLAAGLWALARSRGSTADRAALLEAVIVVVGLGLGLFLFALSVAGVGGQGLEDPRVLASFSIGVPALAIAVWLALTPGPERGTIGLLVAATAAQSVGDATLGLSLRASTLPVAPEPLWLLSLVCFGAAGLHSTIARAVDPPLLRPRPRFVLLGAAILAPTIGTLTRHLFPGAEDSFALDLVATAVAILAIARIRSLFGALEFERQREAAAHAFAEEVIATSPGIVIRGLISDGSLTYASPALLPVLGYRPEDVVGVPGWLPRIVHPDDLDRFTVTAGQSAAMGAAVTSEARMRHADGSHRTMLIALRWESQANGLPTAFLGTWIDVTDWRTAQAELTAATGFLGDVVYSAPVVFMRGRGPDLTLDYVSPNIVDVLGFRPAEVIGVPGWPVQLFRADDREAAKAALAPSIEHREERHEADLRVLTADGRTRTMLMITRRDFAHDGTWQFTSTLLDVTERRETEDALRQAKDEAERANRAKSEFLSGVSHELRTPLNAVLGFGQLLERAHLADPDDRDAVMHILRGGHRLLEMIDGLLDLARMEAGRITLSIEPVSVDDVVRESVDLIRPTAVARGITILLPEPDPGAWVLADARRLSQVILNLLSNAVKHSPPDAEIEVRREPGGAAGRWRICVVDRGQGITLEARDRLFAPFRRGAPAGDRAFGALGVGLALSAGLIEAMAGSIGVDSTPGAGSTFHVELPATNPPVRTAEPGAPRPAGEAVQRTILYIEDNLPNLGLVERILSAQPGTRLLAAMQGRLGLDLAGQHDVDLVLLDLHLPDISGDEVLEGLRADPRTRDVPILILSSTTEAGWRKRLRDLGADAILAKPIEIDEFLVTVDRLLEKVPAA